MTSLDELIGRSPAVTAVREKIARLLSRPAGAHRLPPVLIQGETGTGKGLVARAIHRAGPRAAGPFVDVNCAAIPETLLEAEMFGFERGAFTDARQAKRGLFQAAHHGTLFLDEAGLLPEGLQAKLLKVIEERVVRRLGSTQSEPVDVWIIAATSTDLQAATRERRFREDLYHRLAVLTVSLPPLRARGQDVLLLAEHFLARACTDYGLAAKSFDPSARAALLGYAWPGNVRELANVMERVALLSEAPVVTADMLGLPDAAVATPAESADAERTAPLADTVATAERAHLLDALQATGWNITRAASRLGVSRNTLRYRIEKHGLRPGATPAPPASRAVRAAPPPATPAPAPAGSPPSTAIRWERRRLTVLRATVTLAADGTTPLESSRAIELVLDKVRSFGGRVEALSPKGVVAVFGLEPVEDAPRRAANAALAIQRAVERIPEDNVDPFAVRIGIHVGQFTIGRAGGTVEIDDDTKREAWSVVDGVATRAEPGAILVSGPAAAFLERRFDLIASERAEPGLGPAYRLAGLERPEFEATGGTARFVGRERELELLRGLLAVAKAGRGQVVGIVGEPGIGKSRLLYEFRQGLAGEALTCLEARCVEYGSGTPYLPVLDLVRQSCGVIEGDDPSAVVEKVCRGLAEVGMEPAEGAPYLLHLLGTKDGMERLEALGPEVIKARTFEIVRQMTLKGSQRRPIVLAIEDLHWIDTMSEELLGAVVESLATAPILLLTTYRPGYRPPWMERSYATQIAIGPLSSGDSLLIVRSVLQVERIPEPLARTIVAKAQGNPFFLEELARTIGEQGRLRESAAVPDTVEQALLARIDRLRDELKRVLQTASVLGQDVPVRLLHEVWTEPAGVGAALRELGRLEFLYEKTGVEEPAYVFKHALTQEVAYGSLLEEERRALHARAAAAVERLWADRLVERADQLAYHALRGQVWDKALAYLRQAGVNAVARSAHREAVTCFEQALAALGHLPDGREAREQAIDLRFDLRTALTPLGEQERIFEYLEDAEGLAKALDDQRRLGRAHAYLTDYFRLMGRYDEALAAGERALAVAEAQGDFPLQVALNIYLGQVCYATGDYRRGVASLRKNVEALTGALERERFGLPYIASVHSRTWLVLCLAELGEFAEGIQRGEEALRIAESAEHPFSLASPYIGLGPLYLRQGDLDRAIPALRRGLELSQAWNIWLFFPGLAFALGSAYALSGRLADALSLLTDAVERAASMHRTGGQSDRVASLSQAHLLAGRVDEALPLAQQALTLARTHRERGFEAWILRLLAEVALESKPPDPRQAADHYHQATTLAEALGMRPLIAHCRLGLGRLHRRAGARAEAERDLTAAVTLFRAMGMTRALREAEAELQASSGV